MMEEFFTWNTLGTYAGATLATTLLTELIKNVGFFKRVPTRLVSFVLAVLLLIAAAAFDGTLTLSCAFLALINGAVVSLAANGAFSMVKKNAGTSDSSEKNQ